MKEKAGGKSQERLLEKIMRIIPGYSGYKEKEHIRETDKLLREYLGHELDRLRKVVERAMKSLTDKKAFGLLDDFDSQVKRMQKYADNIRFASYGYSGFFSEVKIRETELQDIYSHDQRFIESLAELKKVVDNLDVSHSEFETVNASIDQLETVLDKFEDEIQKRKYLFN